MIPFSSNLTHPSPLSFAVQVGMVMLIFLIAFAFSLVSPILLPMALLFFVMVWLFWRWALLYVYVRKWVAALTCMRAQLHI